MIDKQLRFLTSPYLSLYEKLIPEKNLLRQLNHLVDFSFIEEELMDKYCMDNGRNAQPPVRMFKYLLLKVIYDLSDRDLIERARFDMSFKYFLNLAPEDDVIHPSLLAKFRRQRLKDVDLLDLLIRKTVQIAIENGVLLSNSIIVDATHTCSRYNRQSPVEILRNRSKKLRKSVYAIDETIKEKFPPKNIINDFENEKLYTEQLITVLEKEPALCEYPAVKEKLNLLKETLDDSILYIQSSTDEDAKTGHKTADTSFFGYKSHIAMSDERIITAATITSGDKGDSAYLKTLVDKSIENGVQVKEVLGDTAYSGRENIAFCKENRIELISKIHPTINHINNRNSDKFTYNKDAQMYVCQAGHMAIHKRKDKCANRKQNARIRYDFDIEKCKICPYKEGCYNGTKKKTFTVAVLSDEHRQQIAFQETEDFKMKYSRRYKIEAKNAELKDKHGYAVTHSSDLSGMILQGATTLFFVNLKRILKLMEENK